MVNLIANPLVLRAVALFLCCATAFLFGMIVIRRVRKSLTEETDLHAVSTSPEGLPLHLYNTVIQQLKQQKYELHVQSQAEQQRARLTETFSQAVLTNLCSGVVVFGPNGLVKTSNPAAKEILGITSISGMSPQNIFRSALVRQTVVRPAKENQPAAKPAGNTSVPSDQTAPAHRLVE
jgi:nitrogen fixation/metabolism regulation signal transduction histidine kinase